MKINLSFLPITLFVACNSGQQPAIPPNANVYARYIVVDEHLSPKVMNCSEKAVPFRKMNDNDCSFILGEYEFDIKSKIILSEKGGIDSFANYLPEGPDIHLRSDQRP